MNNCVRSIRGQTRAIQLRAQSLTLMSPGDHVVQQVRHRVAEVFIPLLFLSSANVWARHDKEPKAAAAQLQKVYPGFTVQTSVGWHWTDDPTFNAQYQRLAEGMRKAGVPEGEKKTD